MVLQEISASWLLTIVISTLVVFWFWTKNKKTYSKYKIPPFPVKPWPIVGHFFMMTGNLRDKMKEWREKAGDLYSLDVGGKLNILVNDYNLLKEIWVKHADRIVNLQDTFGNELLGEINKGIIGAKDDNWKEQRTTSLSILRSFGMGKNLMAEKIQEEVSVILDKLASFKGQPEDVRLLLNVSVSNVICSVTVGKRFEYEDPYFAHFIVQLRDVIKYAGIISIITPLKYLYYLPGDMFHVKRWYDASSDINERFSKAYIKEFKQRFNHAEEPDNFITAYLKEMGEKDMKTNLSEANLIAVVRTLFLAGTDTTSTTMLWCLLYMLHYPEVQEKVYREIEEKVGTARVPSMNDRPSLTYLNAVIMETQRMASLVPSGFRREVSETFEVHGYTIPKGSILWPVLDSVHYEKKIWGDPHKFRPERFIDEKGSLINREELIPFSIGRRQCLGESLARMEIYLFLSAMFQRFKFEPVNKSDELPTLKESYGGVVVPQPFKLRFIDRR